MAPVRSFHKPLLRFFFGGLLSLFLGATLSTNARAQTENGWSVCNQTSMIVEVSTGRPSGSNVIVEGWSRIRAGECRVLLAAPLNTGPHFIYARSSRAHRSGVREWTGDYEFCVDAQGSFSVESPPNCVAMGLEARQFQPVLIESNRRWKTTLRETEKWTEKTSAPAGLQRLLNDAGVSKTKIDGYIGRRTRQAIREFLSSKDLSTDLDDDQIVDYLEQVAIERARNLGFTICNRTDEATWTAIARRRGEGWESRGWWRIEAGACERVIDEELLAARHYVLAEIESDAGRKRLSGATEEFCITRSKFAILGRDECGKKFFDQEKFVETNFPENGRLVYELFDRNFEFSEKPDDGRAG